MKRTMIEDLYFEFINGSEYQDIKPVPYAEKTQKEFENFVKALDGDKEVKDEILDKAYAMSSGSEVNGFVIGFKFAARIFCESFK